MESIMKGDSSFILLAFSGTMMGIILACVGLAQGLRGFVMDRPYLIYTLLIIFISGLTYLLLWAKIISGIEDRTFDITILTLMLVEVSWLFFIIVAIIFYYIEWPREYKRYEAVEGQTSVP